MRLALVLCSLASASASECSGFNTCSSCAQHNALSVLGTKCYWCAADDEGNRCHDIGAVLTSKCYGLLKNTDCIASPTSTSTCPMLSPDFCPEAVPQVRITKGLMSRSYNSVRVSLISPSDALPSVAGFDYNSRFQWKWDQLALSSKLLEVPAELVAAGQPFEVPFGWMHGNGSATINLPRQGEGAVGLIIADPCVKFGLGAFPGYCTAGDRFRTAERIPEMTNAIMADGSVAYWATLGDNWYDPKGDISQTLYARYSSRVLNAFNVVIPGNHDYWSFGPSVWPSPFGEQCGNGFMQWNGMDTMAAKNLSRGSAAPPFDFSVDPETGVTHGQQCAAKASNMNFYQQLGNVGIIGYTGALNYADLQSFFEEACAAVGAEPSVDVVILVSHWDTGGGVTGGFNDSTTPAAFSRVMKIDGCQQFHARQVRDDGAPHCMLMTPIIAC